MDPHLDFDEKEIHEMEREVEELEEKYENLDFNFWDPPFIISPIRITYKGEKVGLFGREFSGSIEITKKDGKYLLKKSTNYYIKNIDLDPETYVGELSKKEGLVHPHSKNGKRYAKNRSIIKIKEEKTSVKPKIESHIKNVLEPLEN